MVENKYSIRAAVQTDIKQMQNLLKVLFSIEEDFVFDEKKQGEGLKLMLANQNGCIIVAEAEEGIIGMCSAQILISTAEGGQAAMIEDVVVKEGFRGRGIGGALLGFVEKWAEEKGVKRLQLLADAYNINALDFYSKNNWRKTNLICLHKKF